MASSSEVASETETNVCVAEERIASEIITASSEYSTSETPSSDPLLGPPVENAGQEVLSVEDLPVQEQSRIGCCRRCLRSISTKQLIWYTLYCIAVFTIVLAIFLVDNPILTIATLVIIAVIFTVFIIMFIIRTVREKVAEDKRDAEARRLDQEAGNSSPSETLPQSTPEQITSSIESETSSSTPVTRNPSGQLEVASPQVGETTAASPQVGETTAASPQVGETTAASPQVGETTAASPQVGEMSAAASPQVEEASIDELSSKSDDQAASEESVRKRHKSNEKTE